MIRKVICPVDFSPSAYNAIEYAAHIARLAGAELELLNFQLLPAPETLVPVGFRKREVKHDLPVIEKELERISSEVNRIFHITCFYETEVGEGSLTESIRNRTGNNDLVVAGTNGADDLFQRLFGSGAFNIVRESDCPVMVIPESVSYSTIRKIVFAWDYDMKNWHLLRKIKEWTSILHAKIVLLHISKHLSSISKDVADAAFDKASEIFGDEKEADYRRLYSSDTKRQIDEFMRENTGDILAVTLHSGRMLRRMIAGNIHETEYRLPTYPLLVFPSK